MEYTKVSMAWGGLQKVGGMPPQNKPFPGGRFLLPTPSFALPNDYTPKGWRKTYGFPGQTAIFWEDNSEVSREGGTLK